MIRERDLETRLRNAVRSQLSGHSAKLAPIDAGIPDRLVLLPGGHLELIELKADSGALEPIQKLWHERAARLGSPVTVLTGRAEIDEWVAQRNLL